MAGSSEEAVEIPKSQVRIEIEFGEAFQAQNNSASINKVLEAIRDNPQIDKANLLEALTNAFSDGKLPILHPNPNEYRRDKDPVDPKWKLGEPARYLLEAFEISRFTREMLMSLGNSFNVNMAYSTFGVSRSINYPAGSLFDDPVDPMFSETVQDTLSITTRGKPSWKDGLIEGNMRLGERTVKLIKGSAVGMYVPVLDTSIQLWRVTNRKDFTNIKAEDIDTYDATGFPKVKTDLFWGFDERLGKEMGIETFRTQIFLPFDSEGKLKVGRTKVIVFQGLTNENRGRGRDKDQGIGIFSIFSTEISDLGSGNMKIKFNEEQSLDDLLKGDMRMENNPEYGVKSFHDLFDRDRIFSNFIPMFRFFVRAVTGKDGKPFWYDQVLGGSNSQKLLRETV